MPNIAQNLTLVHQKMALAAQVAGRDVDEITLLAVSKTQPAAALEAAYGAGQQHFGENYLQEALEKMAVLSHLPLVWHFIGPIQSNKTRALAEHFDWVHSVDRLKIAQRLAQQRPAHLPPLQLCLQVNIDQDPGKAGCHPEQALELVQALGELPQLHLRGLMALPKPGNSATAFAELRQLRDHVRQASGQPLDTLSMGMSGDLDEAIAQGATLVRIGSAIFGARAHATESEL